MIYAGYAAEKYLDNQDGMTTRPLLWSSWRRPKSCCHVILARVFLRHRSTQNDSVVLVIKKPTRKRRDLSLKPKACRLSLPLLPRLDSPFWTQGRISEGIRALQAQLDRDPTNNKLRLRIVREYLTLGDRVSAASVAGDGGQSSLTGTLSAVVCTSRRTFDWRTRSGNPSP